MMENTLFKNMSIILDRKTSTRRMDEILKIEKHLERRGYRKIIRNYDDGDAYVMTKDDGTYFYLSTKAEFDLYCNLKSFKPSNFNDIRVSEVLNYRYLVGFLAGVFFGFLLFWIIG